MLTGVQSAKSKLWETLQGKGLLLQQINYKDNEER